MNPVPSNLSPLSRSPLLSSSSYPVGTPTPPTIGENLDKFTSVIMGTFNLTQAKAEIFALQIFLEQRISRSINRPSGCKLFRASNDFPFSYAITKKGLYYFKNPIASGSYSVVLHATFLPTERHFLHTMTASPSKPLELAVKRPRGTIDPTTHKPVYPHPFSPEKRKLAEASNNTNPAVDTYLETLKDQYGCPYSVHQKYDNPLSKTTFESIAEAIKVCLDVSGALAVFHANDYVHRDIKGHNILTARDETGELKTAITDFGFLSKVSTTEHETIGTPEFLDPRAFGKEPYESVYNQRYIVTIDQDGNRIKKHRQGIQSKAGDVYAFGLTVYLSVLLRLFEPSSALTDEQKTAVNTLKTNLAWLIKPITSEDNFESLKSTTDFHLYTDPNKTYPLGCLILHPTQNKLRDELAQFAASMESFFTTSAEFKAFKQLSNLVIEMRHELPEKRPTMTEVHEGLNEIYQSLHSSPASSGSSSSSGGHSADDGVAPNPKRQKSLANLFR